MRFVQSFIVLVGLLCGSANAAYTITFSETGGNVIANGGGSINTAALTLTGSATRPTVRGGDALAYIGGTPSVFTPMSIGSVVGPGSFGTQFGDTLPDSVTGDLVGIVGVNSRLFVPPGYVSGTPFI